MKKTRSKKSRDTVPLSTVGDSAKKKRFLYVHICINFKTKYLKKEKHNFQRVFVYTCTASSANFSSLVLA
jgi:hypothetical protein